METKLGGLSLVMLISCRVNELLTWWISVFILVLRMISKSSKVDCLSQGTILILVIFVNLKTLEMILIFFLLQRNSFGNKGLKGDWIRDGEANTKIFHANANSGKKRSFISKLFNENGVAISNQQDICLLAKKYLETLYAHSDVNIEVEKWEFKEAVFHVHSDKSPCSDGFNPAFYKRF